MSNGLRLSTWSGYDGGSSTSLPPVGLTPATTVPPQREREPVRSSKEPERRHSLYDSASRGRNTANNNTGSSSSGHNNNNSNNNNNNSGAISAMNVNGLPEPFGPPLSRPPSSSTIHSLHQEPRTRHSGAGTPQFRSLAGVGGSVVFPGPRPGRGSLSNLSTTQGNNGFIQRSVSGNNLYIEDSDTLGLHNRETSFKGSTSTIDQEYNSTPSPSDSAVGDLETVLKEKDNEIIYLRETMEQNEQVIFKVYEEKERVWERELRKIKGLYENRLKANQQKASKMEQALMNQTLQVKYIIQPACCSTDTLLFLRSRMRKGSWRLSWRSFRKLKRNCLKRPTAWSPSCVLSGERLVIPYQVSRLMTITLFIGKCSTFKWTELVSLAERVTV